MTPPGPRRDGVRDAVLGHALAHPAWGHRKIWAMVRHDGHAVSESTVRRLLRDEGLILPAAHQWERRRLAQRRKAAFATEPTGPNQVWQLDFSEFETTTGGTWRLAAPPAGTVGSIRASTATFRSERAGGARCSWGGALMGVVRVSRATTALVATAAALFAIAGCHLGEAPTTYPTPGGIAGIGDPNGDGHLDVLTEGDGQAFGVMVGDGTGGFTVTTVAHDISCTSDDYVTCSEFGVHAVSDLNADGLDDVLIERHITTSYPPPADNSSVWQMDVRLADPSGGFGASSGVGTRPTSSTLEVADVTDDGRPDIVVADQMVESAKLRVRPGLSTGGFGTAIESPIPDDKIDELYFTDLNRDGHADLVAGGTCVDFSASGESFVRACIEVAVGNGSGAFAGRSRYMLADPAADVAVVDFGDVDEDGNLDVVAAARSRDVDGEDTVGTLSFFHGDGTGALGTEVTMPARRQTTRAMLADFDADAHLDLLTAVDDDHDYDDRDNFGRILFGDGAGQFADLHLVPNGVGVVADVDADGRPDYLQTTGEATAAEVKVFMNRWDGRPS